MNVLLNNKQNKLGINIKNKIKLIVTVLLVLGTIFYLTYDIIMTNILSSYYCNKEPNPKTFINKQIEYPQSIYWEDNVYPGFSEKDRKLMIINYLDGKHLKTIALNGDDGKIYVYTVNENDYEKIIQTSNESRGKYKQYQEYAKFVMENEKIYTKETMPKINYSVISNEVKLAQFTSKFLYSDETKIIENSTNEVIGFNRRYMRFFYKLFPNDAFENIYYSDAMCGEKVAHLEYKVFDAYKWSYVYLGNHQKNLHQILIKRNKREK